MRRLLPLVLLIALSASAQDWPRFVAPGDSAEIRSEELVRRQVEALMRSGRREEAARMLEERGQQSGLSLTLERRLARIYRDLNRYAELEALLQERLARGGSEPDISDLRLLAEARYGLGKPAQAREALDRILDQNPADASLMRLVANVLAQFERHAEAIQVLRDGRERLDDPSEFAQFLGSLYSALGQWPEAAEEYLRVIATSPANMGLMRAQILELAERPDALAAVRERGEQAVAAHPNTPQLAIVLAELRQRSGDADAAWQLLRPYVGDPALLQDLVQMAMAGLADSRLPGGDPRRILGGLKLSSRVLKGLLLTGNLPRTLEPRVYDTMNRTLMAILENQTFANMSEAEKLPVLEEARSSVLEMSDRMPNSRVTSEALLRLGNVYIDVLHRPAEATTLFDRLYRSPSASREQLQLARVGLGRSYVASGDTAQARAIFTAMGHDRDFREGQGRAHYQLGLLDFMGGHYTTAQERLSSVALDEASADYTNDSLDLALILAEQVLSGSDEEGLAHYGRALYYRATRADEEMRRELEAAAEKGEGALGERSLLDLARHHQQYGRHSAALATLARMDGRSNRYAAPALELRGDLLRAAGQPAQARALYERILVEYEDYVMMDAVRDKIRALQGQADPESELP